MPDVMRDAAFSIDKLRQENAELSQLRSAAEKKIIFELQSIKGALIVIGVALIYLALKN